MFEISPLSCLSPRTAAQLHRALGAAKSQPETTELSADDQLELSGAARNYEGGADGPSAMDQRIRSLRDQIAAGTYVTDDKLNYVVDRLHEVLFSGRAEQG